MSKSKGNFFTVRDILKDYDGEVIRFFLLSGHYRNPINFSDALMEQAKAGLARMENAKENLRHLMENGSGEMTDAERETLSGYDKYRKAFMLRWTMTLIRRMLFCHIRAYNSYKYSSKRRRQQRVC